MRPDRVDNMIDGHQKRDEATENSRASSDRDNDLTALLSHVGMSESAYREFVQPKRARSAAAGMGISQSISGTTSDAVLSPEIDPHVPSRHSRTFPGLRQQHSIDRNAPGISRTPDSVRDLLNRSTESTISSSHISPRSIHKPTE